MSDRDLIGLSDAIGGYSYVPGGITNQKLALFGLFVEAIEAERNTILTPDLLIFDSGFDHKFMVPENSLVRWDEYFDLAGLHNFTSNYGIKFSVGPTTQGKFGWHFFRSGLEYIQREISGKKYRFDGLAKEFFANLIPKCRFSPHVCALKEKLYGDDRVSTVVQLRIEKDWQGHVESGHHPVAYDCFDAIKVLEKIRNTISVNVLFVCCDESNLPIDKEIIRKNAADRLGLDLLFKSDCMPIDVSSRLNNLEFSLIDFEIARAAPRFVGISSSSYSCMLAFERRHLLDNASSKQDYIYDVPGPGIAERDDGGSFDRPELSARGFFEAKRRDFYFARTYIAKSGNEYNRIRLYKSRLELEDVRSEEYFIASYQIASLMSSLNYAESEVIEAYETCIAIAGGRVEPFHGLARYYRIIGRYKEGAEVSGRVLHVTLPAAGMDIEAWIYDYGLLDEYAVNAYLAGLFLESAYACVLLLAKPALPAAHRERIEQNARLAIANIARR